MRQAERRAIRNRGARSAVRTYVKKATEAVASTAENAAEIVRAAVSALDKAAKNGIVHRNAAARRKSRLTARLHQLSLAPADASAAAQEADSKKKAPAKRATPAKAPAAAKTTAAKQPAARKPSGKKN
jgi:small subunit ribosomal protein S20